MTAILRTDTFSGAAGPLDASWTQQRTGPNSTVNYDGAGNATAEDTAGRNPYAFDNLNAYNQNQYVKGTVGGLSSGHDWAQVTTRAFGAGDASYVNYLATTDGASGAGHTEFAEITADVKTVLRNFATTFTDGDVLELQSIGVNHEVFKNGVSLGTQVDSSHAAGSAGLGFDDLFGGTTPLISLWEAGNIDDPGPVRSRKLATQQRMVA